MAEDQIVLWPWIGFGVILLVLAGMPIVLALREFSVWRAAPGTQSEKDPFKDRISALLDVSSKIAGLTAVIALAFSGYQYFAGQRSEQEKRSLEIVTEFSKSFQTIVDKVASDKPPTAVAGLFAYANWEGSAVNFKAMDFDSTRATVGQLVQRYVTTYGDALDEKALDGLEQICAPAIKDKGDGARENQNVQIVSGLSSLYVAINTYRAEKTKTLRQSCPCSANQKDVKFCESDRLRDSPQDLSTCNLPRLISFYHAAAPCLSAYHGVLSGVYAEGIFAPGSDFREADMDGFQAFKAYFVWPKSGGAKDSLKRFTTRDEDLSNLNCADTRFVKFFGAQLNGAEFFESVLACAEFSPREWSSTKPTELSGAKFQGANLDQASFAGAKASKASFEGAKARKSDFKLADLTKAQFNGTDLTGGNFEGATLIAANFEKAILAKTNLKNAKFDGANVTGADFTGATDVPPTLTEACLHADKTNSQSPPKPPIPPIGLPQNIIDKLKPCPEKKS